ncbi:hypothetical protein [Sphingobacterium faecium]|uniref:hypothetical protein n=1 Tax=Sphingobacterium faecium TaxID=34087 RepID=UPI003209EF87
MFYYKPIETFIMESKNIFGDCVVIGNREYVFDVVVNTEENLDLVISENQPAGVRIYQNSIRIPIEDVKAVRDTLSKLIERIDKITRVRSHSSSEILENLGNNMKNIDKEEIDVIYGQSPKSYTLDDKRKVNAQAYLPWSVEDDERLEVLFCEGRSIRDLAEAFERNEGAISSRIKKLELKEKYG